MMSRRTSVMAEPPPVSVVVEFVEMLYVITVVVKGSRVDPEVSRDPEVSIDPEVSKDPEVRRKKVRLLNFPAMTDECNSNVLTSPKHTHREGTIRRSIVTSSQVVL